MSDKEVEEGLPQDATSTKRKPSWLKKLVKEAEESVGPPRREVRERNAPNRFSSYMEVVTSLCESALEEFWGLKWAS